MPIIYSQLTCDKIFVGGQHQFMYARSYPKFRTHSCNLDIYCLLSFPVGHYDKYQHRVITDLRNTTHNFCIIMYSSVT